MEDSRSVLLVSDQYVTYDDDSATINRQVVQTLTGAGRRVYSLVLEDTEEDRKCAEADGVELILPRSSQGDTRKPCLDWMTFDHLTHYPRLPQDVGCIVGHTEVTSRAAATIKEDRFPEANLILVTQTIPEDTEKYKEEQEAMRIGEKEESIRQDAEKADTVFSVGHRTQDHFTNTFLAIPKDKRPTHYLFLPEPSGLFQKTTVEYRETKEKVVLIAGRVNTVERVKGFDLAVKALSKVVERSQDRIQLRICGVCKEEYQASMKTLQTSINSGKLIPTLLPRSTQEDICQSMQQAHLVLMPSRTEPFGLVGLSAMAAGVPVLISDQSGLATLVNEVIPEFHHSILGITGDDSIDVRHWADQIQKVLRMSKAEFSRAAALKQKLLESKYWEESQQCFLQACGGAGTSADHDVQQPAKVQEKKRDVGPDKDNEGRKVTALDIQTPGQVNKRKRDTDPTGETDESRKAIKKEASPPLPIVVEILAQVISSVKSPKQMKDYAAARETLVTLDITTVTDESLYLLKQIKAEIKNMEDLIDIAEAIKQIEKFKGVNVTDVKKGSLVFYLQCTDLHGLGELWFMYKNGKLDSLLHSSLIREETLQQLCAQSISVKAKINIEDFRKTLVYLVTTSAATDQPISRLVPQEYPLYQPRLNTTTNVLDVLHLDDTELTRSPVVHHDLHIPSPAQTEDSQHDLGTKLGKLKIGDDQQDTEAPDNKDVPLEVSELASLDIRELEQLMGQPRKRTSSMGSGSSGYQTGTPRSGPSRPDSPTGEPETQGTLGTLLAELNTSAVMKDKAQQIDLYCQIGDLYRTKLHNLQAALQYYQYMLECSQALSEDTKQAKAYNRLGLIYDILGLEQEAFRNHERALAIYRVETKNETDICVAYKNLASSLALSGQVADAKTNYESALGVAIETRNKTEQMDIYCKLGDLHREQLDEPHISHKYYTEMLTLARILEKKDSERLAYNRLGLAWDDMQDNEAALEWHQKHLEMSHDDGDKKEQITAHSNVGNTYRLLGKLDQATSHFYTALQMAQQTGDQHEQKEIYFWMGEMHREQLHSPRTAIQYYKQHLALARKLRDRHGEGLAYNRLGMAHHEMGEYVAGLEWRQKDLKMSQHDGDKEAQLAAHKNIAASYETLGKPDLARSHYQSTMKQLWLSKIKWPQ
ncbi:TTC28 [Branchiostoma lanceolatum]|uniref:TTC28 protein n=1 Tax=Branchiostoma lanceolatum TaxID=7740 RepID=A0A8J9ZK97_BRALA|nr:TTC28 [Branchiostoma lanceolatum]